MKSQVEIWSLKVFAQQKFQIPFDLNEFVKRLKLIKTKQTNVNFGQQELD